MTHEFLEILNQANLYKAEGIRSVLATVVALDGSSYRKPGVRMLIAENGRMTGAVSGGCVEKEVLRRTETVFKTGKAKMMTYDGRYRLGCEGVLYILLELFEASEILNLEFDKILSNRSSFEINSVYTKQDEIIGDFGSYLLLKDGQKISFHTDFQPQVNPENLIFTQKLKPRFKLLIVGGEHDAVKLCSMAAMLGWQVEVITSIKDTKELKDFPGASKVSGGNADTFVPGSLDVETAVVLMTHNYAQDLQYLVKLKEESFSYLGILGSVKRRENLKNELFDYAPDLNPDFLDAINSPAGLDIGSITPEEIALSILAEILAKIRNRDAQPLSAMHRVNPKSL